MSAEPRIIPARLSVKDLAETTSTEVGVLRRLLAEGGHDVSEDDLIGADIAIEVGKQIGCHLTVESRDLALERLYEYETRGELSDDPGGRAGTIVEGVISSIEELDAMIEEVAEHWSVARMPLVDRNILRIALFELKSDHLTPTPVVLAEAVRLGQTYSTERSSAFINGVLATLAETVR